MSWAAHELETYFIQVHVKFPLSFLAVLIGGRLPDLFTKAWVYGFDVGGVHLQADNPAQFHRGWPGAGFTHSLFFGVAIALLVLWLTRHKGWALGLLIGHWAHALTDINDTVGTMLFWPFFTEQISTGMWAYAAEAGHYGDAAAYYSGLGGVWDFLWVLIVLLSWRSLSASFFWAHVQPVDPVWGWLQRVLHMPDVVVVALYRCFFFYGACRAAAWTLWARVVEPVPWDISWGGPGFANAQTLDSVAAGWEIARVVAVGSLALAAAMFALWWLPGRYLWARATR